MHKIYIAGPDVFAPDWKLRARRYIETCSKHGLHALIPESVPPENLTGWQRARWIKEANVGMIRSCDAVIANITPFRGPNVDDGTAFEIGFAEALGRPVLLWSERSGEAMTDRIPHAPNDTHIPVDREGWTVEDFGLTANLMIAINEWHAPPFPLGSFEAAVLLAARVLSRARSDQYERLLHPA